MFAQAVVQDRASITTARRRRPAKGGKFAIIIDPSKCKGCAECVTVCDDDALKMIPKTDEVMTDIRKSHRCFKDFGPSDEQYINDNLLIDMMLKEQTHIYVGGAGSCAGCGEGTALRMLCAATGAKYGDQWGIIAATGCNTVYTSTYPYNPYLVPWTNSLFENAPAYAMGVRMRWDQMGWQDKPLWCIGGDGAMFDIGFQSLSRMLASGMNIKVFVLDTQVYSNTGGQASTSTYTGQNTKMSVHGKTIGGKTGTPQGDRPDRHDASADLRRPDHLRPHESLLSQPCSTRWSSTARRSICCYTTCQPEHGVADNMATDQARLAVDTRAFPLLIYDPRKGDTIRERLSLQGNPAVNDDWWTQSQDRRAGRLHRLLPQRGPLRQALRPRRQSQRDAAAGQAGPAGKLAATPGTGRSDRRQRREGQGRTEGGRERHRREGGRQAGAGQKAEGNGLPPGYSIGSRIRYNDGAAWLTGTIKSTSPAVLQLDDGSTIEVSGELLREAIAVGIIALQA